MRNDHSPTPTQVAEGKTRIDNGQRIQEGDRQLRPYFCRSCGKMEDAYAIPMGWYSMTRHSGNLVDRSIRLGIYCSIECIQDQLPRLKGIDKRVNMHTNDSPYIQRRDEGHKNNRG